MRSDRCNYNHGASLVTRILFMILGTSLSVSPSKCVIRDTWLRFSQSKLRIFETLLRFEPSKSVICGTLVEPLPIEVIVLCHESFVQKLARPSPRYRAVTGSLVVSFFRGPLRRAVTGSLVKRFYIILCLTPRASECETRLCVRVCRYVWLNLVTRRKSRMQSKCVKRSNPKMQMRVSRLGTRRVDIVALGSPTHRFRHVSANLDHGFGW